MSNIKHATIIPLIGGMTLAQEEIFGSRPEYLMSYEPFVPNETHLLNHYNHEVPYYLLDKGQSPDGRVDVVNALCPCAGLSMMSNQYGADNPHNKWLMETARYILSEIKPQVFWGENSPHFAGNIGKPVRENMLATAKANGYTMTVYKTKSVLHGIPQIRPRSFYFFWKGNKTPILEYYNRPMKRVENLLSEIKSNFQQELVNEKTPSKIPIYEFVLNEMHGGMDHHTFVNQMTPDKGMDLTGYISDRDITEMQVADWMKEKGYESEYVRFKRKSDKLAAGGQVMQRSVYIPKNYMNSFAGWLKTACTHTTEDRFLSYRECMSLMGLPENFELLDPKKNLNHVAQNVPLSTAKDMTLEVKNYLEGNRTLIDATYILQSNVSQKTEYVESPVKTLSEYF